MGAVKWVSTNWEGILAVVGTMLTVMSSLKQLLERYPRAEKVLDVAIDLLSLVPRKGQRGVLGKHANLPGVPSLPENADRQNDDDDDGQPPVARIPLVRAALFVGFILPLTVVVSGCGTTRAQWKTAGIDAARCAAPAVIDAAGDAMVEYLNTVAASTSLDYAQLGRAIATKYGTDVALCALGKIWNDFGGGSTVVHGKPTPAFAATAYLINHQEEWLYPSK